MPEAEVANILSIDLEEWDQLAYRRLTGKWPPVSKNIFRQMDALLDLLRMNNAKATFFVVGMLAQREPDLIAMLSAEGHEIACHGYEHLIVDRLTPEEFKRDTARCKAVLEEITGVPVIGYRAAEFSIRGTSLWALDILAELGFDYDSSIFPVRHRRYGIPNFSPRVKSYDLPNGLQIAEFPPASVRLAGFQVPIAGGGYFRFASFGLLKKAVQSLNAAGTPFTTYFHPYEFDPEKLDVLAAGPAQGWKQHLHFLRFNLHQNLLRRTLPIKISGLLRLFQFTTFRDYLSGANLSDRTAILSATRN